MEWLVPRTEALHRALATPPVVGANLAALALAAAVLAVLGPRMSPTVTVALYATAFLPYALVVAGARETSISVWWFVATAAVVRVALIPADPVLSSDIYRYVWEGRVSLAGFNPFRYAPAADALSHLRGETIWPRVNHPEVPTIYPPGAQFLFQINASFGGGTTGIKLLFVGIEAGGIAICWRLLRRHVRRHLLVAAFVVYALNPLVFVEAAWSGHLDVAAWTLLVVGLVYWQVDDTPSTAFASSLAIGASTAVKFLGLAALPLMLLDRSGRRPLLQRIGAPLFAAGLLVASYVPFAGAGTDLFSGFGTYAQKWRSNDGIYRLLHTTTEASLERWAGSAHRSDGQVLVRLEALDNWYRRLGWTEQWRGRTIPDNTYTADQLASRFAKVAAMFAVGIAALLAVMLGVRPTRDTSRLILVLYLFAPVLHPWYVAWLVPFAALEGRRTEVIFSFAVLSGYLAWLSARTGGPWEVPHGVVALEYGLVVGAWWLESSFDSSGDNLLLTVEKSALD